MTLEISGPDLVGDVERFVYPLFVDRDGGPVSVGSSFIVDFDGVFCLITAAHVLDEIGRGEDLFWYVGRTLKRRVAGRALLSRSPDGAGRDCDRIDIGIVILEGEGLPPYPEISRGALPAQRLRVHATPRHGAKYMVFGYPASKADINRPERLVLSKSYSYLASSVLAEEYEKMGITEQTHIAISFNLKKISNTRGRRVNFPRPAGISGAPLWELTRPEDGGPRVVGVMIERPLPGRSKSLIAVDVGFAVQMFVDLQGRQPSQLDAVAQRQATDTTRPA